MSWWNDSLLFFQIKWSIIWTGLPFYVLENACPSRNYHSNGIVLLLKLKFVFVHISQQCMSCVTRESDTLKHNAYYENSDYLWFSSSPDNSPVFQISGPLKLQNSSCSKANGRIHTIFFSYVS